MQDIGAGGFQSKVGAVTGNTAIVCEAISVIAETELVIGLVKAAIAGDQLGLTIAFESGAGYDIEDTVRAIAILGGVAATLDFEVVDVLGIELRTDVRGNVSVGYGHAVNQPGHLMSAADVQLVVDHIGAGDIVRDHAQANGLVGARSFRNLLATNQACGRGGFRIHGYRSIRDFNSFFGLGNRERKMYASVST